MSTNKTLFISCLIIFFIVITPHASEGKTLAGLNCLRLMPNVHAGIKNLKSVLELSKVPTQLSKEYIGHLCSFTSDTPIPHPMFHSNMSHGISSFLATLFSGDGTHPFSPFVSLLASIILLVLAFLVWQLIKIGLNKFMKHADTLYDRIPSLRDHLNYYLKITRRVAKLALIVLTLLFFLEIWGIDVLPFLTQNARFLSPVIRIPLAIIMAVILIHGSRYIIGKLEEIVGARMESRPGASKLEVDKQVKTIGDLIYKTLFVTILIIAFMMIIKELGFDIKPILASVGVVSLAIGFGAQNLVRDVISGLFMIIENQIRVGDVAILNGTGGLVEAVNLRTTVLRGLDGAQHIFQNGTINSVSNLTHDFSYYLFEIGIAYKEDIDRVKSVLIKISDEIIKDPTYGPEILEPLEILGLDKFGDSAIIIKARIKTKPIKQWLVGREFNYRIKKRFDEENIEIPFPHRTLYFGDASRAFDINIKNDQVTEQQLKKWIQEVLAEHANTVKGKRD